MNGSRERYTEALITLHTFSDPRRLTSYAVSELSAVCGPLNLWCYVQEDTSGHYRLIGGDAPPVARDRRAAQEPSRVPDTLAPPTVQRACRALSDVAGQTLVGEHVPALLRDIWGEAAVSNLQASTRCQPAAMRVIAAAHAPVGLVILASAAPLPADMAYEVAGHVAVALAAAHERSAGTASRRDPFMRSMVALVAQRELDRANRYQRPLSLALLELGGGDPHPREAMTVTSLITRMMRLADTVGRLDDGRLAVLLPETPATGAESFLRRLYGAASRAAVSLHGALATCPDDGRSWDELHARALSRLGNTDAADDGLPRPDAPFSSPVAAVQESPVLDGHCRDTDEAVQHRVRVGPLEQREVGPWQLLLRRLPPVVEVDLAEFRVESALFRVKATSLRGLLRELRRAARTMQADFSVGLEETSIRLWSDP